MVILAFFFVESATLARILQERIGHSETEQMQYIQGFAHGHGSGQLQEDNYVLSDDLLSNPL